MRAASRQDGPVGAAVGARRMAPSGPTDPAGEGGGFLTWLGGLASLTLLFGMAYWGYTVIAGDVRGVVLLRAPEGPMRVAPEDPGGWQVDYQGLAVNAVAALGTAEPPAERLVLAPGPTRLAAEDLPGAELRTLAARRRAAPQWPPQSPPEASPEASPETLPETLPELPPPWLGALPGATPAPAAPRESEADAGPGTAVGPDGSAGPEAGAIAEAGAMRVGAPAGTGEDAAAGETVAVLVPASVPGVRRSLRPAPRPAPDMIADALAVAVARQLAAPGGDPDELAPEALDPGTSLVQLGAFHSAEAARDEWRALARRFDDFFADKRRVLQEAESGGRRFWRLRAAGFADLADARRFCAVLVAQGANCIPVVVR